MGRKAVLIDVDGTLVDSNGAHARSWSQALRRFGYDASPGKIAPLIGMGGDKLLAHIDPALDDRSEPGRSISRLRLRIFLDEYVAMLAPTPGARALLVRLHQAGLKRVIATSAKREELDALLVTAGVIDQIDMATTADDVKESKPDPDLVAGALRKSRAKPEEAIYLGDTPYDVEAARRAEVACIAFRSGGWKDEDLCGATAIYDDPLDLLENYNSSPLAR